MTGTVSTSAAEASLTAQEEACKRFVQALENAIRRPLFEDIQMLLDNNKRRRHQLLQLRDAATANTASSRMRIGDNDETNKSLRQVLKRYDSGSFLESTSKANIDTELEKLSWSELLHEVAHLVPEMTEEQHAQVLHLSTILFLGFLLPFSTGNEHRLLMQVIREGPKTVGAEKFDPVVCLRDMPLVDRLGQLLIHCWTDSASSGRSGEFDCLTDPRMELAYEDFLQRGLLPLLRARPLHRQQVDILHLIAMVICPSPSLLLSSPSSLTMAEESKNSNSINPSENSGNQQQQQQQQIQVSFKARQLMQHAAAAKFHVHYGHRVEWIHFLAEQQAFVLPCLGWGEVTAPLLMGALPHLEASLQHFSQAAQSLSDAQAARAAWVATVAPTRHLPLLLQSWRLLLHQLVQDSARYVCHHEPLFLGRCSSRRRHLQFWPPVPNDKNNGKDNGASFCPHAMGGQILAALVIQGGADLALAAMSSLADAVEWQVDSWTKNAADEDDDRHVKEKKPPSSPCLLMALLHAAKHALTVARRHVLEEEEGVARLVASCIPLVKHLSEYIALSALGVLQVIFEKEEAYAAHSAKQVLQLIQQLGRSKDASIRRRLVRMDGLVRILVRAAPAFSKELSRHLHSKIKGRPEDDNKGPLLEEEESKLLATLWINSPLHILKDENAIKACIQRASTPTTISHLVAASLARRQTSYFVREDAKKQALQLLQAMNDGKTSRWDVYRMACHGMVMGNFLFCQCAWGRLTKESSLSEDNFLWISALHNVSQSERLLADRGCGGIPKASCHLHTALSYLHHLHTMTNRVMDGGQSTLPRRGFAFQSRFLFLRLDQLDLITVIRQLTREMRLTGALPSKNTRHHQHLVNSVRNLKCLGHRFRELNQQYGIHFQSGMSTTMLLVHEQICHFLARTTRSAFHEIFAQHKASSSGNKDEFDEKFATKSRLSISKLMTELDLHVVKSMIGSMEPLVRAEAMLELLDGILMVPCPFPRDFFAARTVPMAELHLSAVPFENAEYGGKSLHTIETYPSLSPALQVNGRIPQNILQNSRSPITNVLLWWRLVYSGPLDDDEASPGDESNPPLTKKVVMSRVPTIQRPYDTFVLVNGGSFRGTVDLPPLLDEGWFVLETKLGCRDARGAEWELHVEQASLEISIHCTRSR